MERVEPDYVADERTMLTQYLDHQRATFVRKARGLSREQMAITVGASDLTLAGLLKHLALVEEHWFVVDFAGEAVPEPWDGVDWDADPDWEFRTALDDDPEQLFTLYDRACRRAREIVASASSLDRIAANRTGRGGEPISLRWILLHMIEETARHNGHADLLRESIDGETGD